jgi:hypothetical protein
MKRKKLPTQIMAIRRDLGNMRMVGVWYPLKYKETFTPNKVRIRQIKAPINEVRAFIRDWAFGPKECREEYILRFLLPNWLDAQGNI